jgi:hypothetical protein
VTSNVSDSESGLLHKGCSHEPLLWGVAVLGTEPKAGARVLVEEAGVVAVGAEVSVASDTDPQAITASMNSVNANVHALCIFTDAITHQ